MSVAQIKLFGKTIPLPVTTRTHSSSLDSDDHQQKRQIFSSLEDLRSSSSVSNGDSKKPEENDFVNPTDPEPSTGNPEPPPIGKEPDSHNHPTDKERSETNSGNAPKKPDKVLACPRCHSVDTKFCYFNNYNLNQPRYFCRKCQRYWTSGGAMRNLAVGSGRRKNKPAFISNNHRNQDNGGVLGFGFNAPVFQEPVLSNFQTVSPIMLCQAPVHWGCNSPGVWGFPCYESPNSQHQILGKRSRGEETLQNPEMINFSFPKRLQSDDPKNPIWSIVGIKVKKNDLRGKNGIFTAFETVENDQKYIGDNSLILQANPVALSRSLNFNENA